MICSEITEILYNYLNKTYELFNKCNCFVKSYRNAFTFDVDSAGFILKIKDSIQYYSIRVPLNQNIIENCVKCYSFFFFKKAHFEKS